MRRLPRLWPRSLFSRLVLVLLAGLAVAQLVSFAIHMYERRDLLLQTSGIQSAQRVAGVVRLLEQLSPAERGKVVKVLSAPPFLVSLDHGPLSESSQPDAGSASSARAVLFTSMLRRLLGAEWPVVVRVTEGEAPLPPRGGPRAAGSPMAGGMMRAPFGPMMHTAMEPGFSFVSQVRLRDGTLVTFDTRLPQETEGWPYRLLLILVVLLTAVVVLSLVAVRWATRPLKTLADAADELGRNIDRAPMQEGGPVEVARAARAFNTMQTRLQAYLRERTRVLAAMSHDLKTPVTRMRLRAELLSDPELRLKFTRDLEEMESMVRAALEFLRSAQDSEPAKPVDMAALLESLQADMTEMGSKINLEGRALRPYLGRPGALKRCLANLLDNAVKYGTSATIRIDDNDQRLTIRILDEGPGIPEAELERVFEPFYRLEASRNRATGGTGLGLAIARSVAEGHGGSLTLHNRGEGGLEARLSLPRSRETAGGRRG
jgi:signal transduction histidine kinase